MGPCGSLAAGGLAAGDLGIVDIMTLGEAIILTVVILWVVCLLVFSDDSLLKPKSSLTVGRSPLTGSVIPTGTSLGTSMGPPEPDSDRQLVDTCFKAVFLDSIADMMHRPNPLAEELLTRGSSD